MQDRLARMRELMAKHAQPAVLLHKPENILYLSGYAGEGCALVTRERQYIFTDFRYVEQAEIQAPGWSVVKTDRDMPWQKALAEALAAAQPASLAVETDYVTVDAYEQIRTAAGEVPVESLKAHPEELRRIKDGFELECLRRAESITARTFNELLGHIRPGITELELRAELEYLPLPRTASFRCDNEDVNRIWDMCVYTLHLNMREVLTEAVKRDRWLWGGDAYQAFKFVKYLCGDKELVRRSLIALRGKEPFCEHINTITDYSLYWVIALIEYYDAYADLDFIRFIYPRAVSLMDFCAGRENGEGFLVKKYADWIFVDWSEIDKTGAVCAEQMLYIAACEAMTRLAALIGEDGSAYAEKAKTLREKVNRFYWNGEKGAYIDSYESGKNNVTRHANIFAILYGIADGSQCESIVRNVLHNDSVTKITTPYFEGFELDVMGMLGDRKYIFDMLCSYWKGMLDLGATTVWEEFDPKLSGPAHYAMYGGKYQKSLCHAWGASPIYLLGKYFLGVRETAPGYASFEVSPQLGGFGFIEGTIPVRDGEVSVYLSGETLRVTATVPGGTLRFGGETRALVPGETVELALK